MARLADKHCNTYYAWLNFGIVLDLKRIQTTHSFFCGFKGDKAAEFEFESSFCKARLSRPVAASSDCQYCLLWKRLVFVLVPGRQTRQSCAAALPKSSALATELAVETFDCPLKQPSRVMVRGACFSPRLPGNAS